MLDRRHFLGAVGLPALSSLSGRGPLPVMNVLARARAANTEEAYWAEIARAFTVDRSLINLNNGGVSPSPAFVQSAMADHLAFSNKAPAHNLWHVLQPQAETVRSRIARFWGVDAEEIALTRNASEGLQICQFGFDLEAGDEVLATDQDYPRMINTFKQRERREGLVLKQFELPTPLGETAEILRLYEEHIGPRTKLILVSHILFQTGQVMPVKEIVALGRSRNVPVIVDGAHAFAHIDFKLSDLDCDYYASSLHKWLFAPHGTGVLYVRKSKIEELWPLMAAPESEAGDIRKFEQIGTHPEANGLAVAEALTFHQGIGALRKLERMIHMRDYWIDALRDSDRVRLHTNTAPGRAGGIATVEIDGLDNRRLAGWLWKKHRILVVYIGHTTFQGIRVSPSVYNTKEELDRFVEAVRGALRVGLPG